jgi:predicted thioesterase
MHRARVGGLVVAIAAAAALAGCQASVEVGPRISEHRLEQLIKDKLADQIGTAPDDVDCPGDLKGRTGTTMTCVLTAGADQLDVAVTVTSVKGKRVNFDYEVADLPTASEPGISEKDLEATLEQRIAEKVGTPPDDVDCPNGLEARVGATQHCVLTSGGQTGRIDVTATGVEGTTVNFDWTVGDPTGNAS